jgi:GT2 family glycosyltransferase
VSEVSSNNAQVAVIIPVRNRPDFLRECLNSLVTQDFPIKQCEVIVCDDHSEEDLESVIEMFRSHLPMLKLLRQQEQCGPAAARNMGFRSSSAGMFVCLDSDIVCNSYFLKELVGSLKANPHWVAAEAALIPNQHRTSPLWDAPVCDHGGRYHTAAIAYRRDAVFRVGGFDETFKLAACEDVDLAARLFKEGVIGFVSEAKAIHPLRTVTLHTHWQWRRSWKYITILAKRYGFLAFPGRDAGRFPRIRVGVAALLTQPGGRFLEACKYMKRNSREGIIAGLYALFDVVCGLIALPVIFFSATPPSRNYLEVKTILEEKIP